MNRFSRVLTIAFLFCPVLFFAAETQRKTTVVLPAFHADFDKSAFKSPDLPNSIILSSFSYYLSDSDLSERVTAVILTNTEFDAGNSGQISKETSADFLVSGTYVMTGDPVTPNVSVTLTVYDAKNKKNILVKTSVVPMGSRLYDLSESMFSDWLKAVIGLETGRAKAVLTGFEKAGDSLKILVNGNLAMEFSSASKEVTLPLLAGRTNLIIVQNSSSDELSRLSIELNNGDTTNIRLDPNKITPTPFRPLHLKIYTMDETMGGVGLEYYFTRNIWAGLNTGFSVIPDKNLYFILPVLEAGYRVTILPNWKLSASGGVLFKSIFALPQDRLKELLPKENPYHGAAGIFLEAEWFGVFVRPAAYYDGSLFYFNGSAGFRF